MALKTLLIDISPLRDSPAFRYAYAARAATVLVTGMLLVAASLQLFRITNSSIAVAALNIAMAVPMVLALIVGGVLSDRRDRRELMLWSRTAYAVGVLLFFGNALLAEPQVALIYLAGVISGAAGGISVPAMMAATPALVGRDRLAAAAALSGLAMQIGGIVGPALAGALIAGPGLVFCYGIVLVGVLVTPFLLYRLPALPPPPVKAHAHPARSFVEGLSFIRANPLLRGLLLIDLAAMILATPIALLPEWGTRILSGDAQVTGLLYAAPAVGATLAALSSGWTRTVAQSGRVLVVAWVGLHAGPWEIGVVGVAQSGGDGCCRHDFQDLAGRVDPTAHAQCHAGTGVEHLDDADHPRASARQYADRFRCAPAHTAVGPGDWRRGVCGCRRGHCSALTCRACGEAGRQSDAPGCRRSVCRLTSTIQMMMPLISCI